MNTGEHTRAHFDNLMENNSAAARSPRSDFVRPEIEIEWFPCVRQCLRTANAQRLNAALNSCCFSFQSTSKSVWVCRCGVPLALTGLAVADSCARSRQVCDYEIIRAISHAHFYVVRFFVARTPTNDDLTLSESNLWARWNKERMEWREKKRVRGSNVAVLEYYSSSTAHKSQRLSTFTFFLLSVGFALWRNAKEVRTKSKFVPSIRWTLFFGGGKEVHAGFKSERSSDCSDKNDEKNQLAIVAQNVRNCQ